MSTKSLRHAGIVAHPSHGSQTSRPSTSVFHSNRHEATESPLSTAFLNKVPGFVLEFGTARQLASRRIGMARYNILFTIGALAHAPEPPGRPSTGETRRRVSGKNGKTPSRRPARVHVHPAVDRTGLREGPVHLWSSESVFVQVGSSRVRGPALGSSISRAAGRPVPTENRGLGCGQSDVRGRRMTFGPPAWGGASPSRLWRPVRSLMRHRSSPRHRETLEGPLGFDSLLGGHGKTRWTHCGKSPRIGEGVWAVPPESTFARDFPPTLVIPAPHGGMRSRGVVAVPLGGL